MLHLATVAVGRTERFARARIPELHDALLVAARQVVPVVAPSQAVHLILVGLYPPYGPRVARVVQVDDAIPEADSKDPVAPGHAADINELFLLPPAQLGRCICVPELDIAARRASREQVWRLLRPLDGNELPAVRRELEQVRDRSRIEVLVVHVSATRHRDRVPHRPRDGVRKEVGRNSWPVKGKHELLACTEVRLCGRCGNLVRLLEQLVVVESVTPKEGIRGRLNIRVGVLQDALVREPEDLCYSPCARRRLERDRIVLRCRDKAIRLSKIQYEHCGTRTLLASATTSTPS